MTIPKNLLLFDAGDDLQVGEELPSLFKVLKYGKSQFTKGGELGEIDFSFADAQAVVKDFLNRGKDLVVDYEHQTLSGTEAPAAGWIKALTADPDGLKASVEWTPRAALMLKGREYRYFSPVLQHRGKVLHSVALTNHPALHGIPALVADDLQDEAEESTVNIENETENTLTKGTTMKNLKKLASLVGAIIPDDMGEDQAIDAIAAGMSSIIERSKASEAAKAGMVSMTDYEHLKGQVVSMEGKMKTANAKAAAAEGIKARKIAPNMEQWAIAFSERDSEGFADYLKLAPEIVPAVPNMTVSSAVSTPNETIALTDTRAKMCALVGLDVETVFGKKK